MTTQPVALGFTEGLSALEELKQRCRAGHSDFAILLAGGLLSRKTIRLLRPPAEREYVVVNHIDNSSQTLTEAELWTESNIGEALDKRALLDLSGDPILDIEGRGPTLASTLHAEAVTAATAYYAERAKAREEDPLRFRLSAAPGALRIGDDDEWEPADPSLLLEPMDIGPATVAQIDLEAVAHADSNRAATTSIELTIEDIDALTETLTALREDAIKRRGFAINANGFWTNGEED